MLHVLFKYPEVYTDLNFIIVPTLPLELQSDVDKYDGGRVIADVAQIGPVSDDVRRTLGLGAYRQHSGNEVYLLNDFCHLHVNIDWISQFSCWPPELCEVFNMVGDYFRWFYILSKKLNMIKCTIYYMEISKGPFGLMTS
eukprot:15358716-Ditylum_brightwellii.AAC.1